MVWSPNWNLRLDGFSVFKLFKYIFELYAHTQGAKSSHSPPKKVEWKTNENREAI